MNFKSLLTATAIAATAFIGGSAVQARTCMNFDAGALCNDYMHSNSYGQVYDVAYYNDRGNLPSEVVRMSVVCNGRNLVHWKGTQQNMSYGQVDYVAEEFCALPNA